MFLEPSLIPSFFEDLQKYSPKCPVITKDKIHVDIVNSINALVNLEDNNAMIIRAYAQIIIAHVFSDMEMIEKDVLLGFSTLEDYLNTETGMGAYIGRNANRIKGASVDIEGVKYKLDANEGNNNLHSGFDRSHCKLYGTMCGESDNEQYVEFYRVSPHLEQGFPGNLVQKIRYTLTENNEFIIDYEITTDKTTIVNPTNHSYFNLDGHNSGSILNHELEVFSDKFLDIDEELIPTGELIEVKGTPMDFRNKKRIGRDIDSSYQALKYAYGYDHTFVFENDRALKKVAKLYGAASGINMTVYTDLCGLQIYTGNYLKGHVGKNGAVYNRNNGICLETQFYPNACNEKRFPSTLLEGGRKFTSRTVYQFEVD